MKFSLSINPKKFSYFELFQTDRHFYLFGSTSENSNEIELLKFSRGLETLEIFEDHRKYTLLEKKNIIDMLKDSNYQAFYRVKKAYGLFGFIQFTKGYYMVLITDRKEVGEIGLNVLYEISDYVMVPLFDSIKVDKAKNKKTFAKMMNKMKGFLKTKSKQDKREKSYSYELTNTLQENMTKKINLSLNNKFVWNSFLLSPIFHTIKSRRWILPVVYGFIGNKIISFLGRTFHIVLIGRRSKYFAGRRYLKRGLCGDSHVANYVETEQIVVDKSSLSLSENYGAFSSYVQIRGSVPLYWSQEISIKMVDPKPDIVLNQVDPFFLQTQKHFDESLEKFGAPLIIFNLLKKKERKLREIPLSEEFENAINYLKKQVYDKTDKEKLLLVSWDFRHNAKESASKCLNIMSSYCQNFFMKTSFFCTRSYKDPQKRTHYLQTGVVRSNCVDGLDRTNVSQLILGLFVLGYQLYNFSVLSKPHLLTYPLLIKILMELYQDLGDTLALQYGGSQTVSSGINYRGYTWDVLTSVKRYYSNNFIDQEKQNAMNLFLGVFKTNKIVTKENEEKGEEKENQNDIWELKWDYYLHEKVEKFEENSIKEKLGGKEIEKNKRELFEEYYNFNNLEDLEKLVQNEPIKMIENQIKSNFLTQERDIVEEIFKIEKDDEFSGLIPNLDDTEEEFSFITKDVGVIKNYFKILIDSDQSGKFSFSKANFKSDVQFYQEYLKHKTENPKPDVKLYSNYVSFGKQWERKPENYKIKVNKNELSYEEKFRRYYYFETLNTLREYFPSCPNNFYWLIREFLILINQIKTNFKYHDKLNYSIVKKKKPLTEILSKGNFYTHCFYGYELLDFLGRLKEIKTILGKNYELRHLKRFLNFLLQNQVIYEIEQYVEKKKKYAFQGEMAAKNFHELSIYKFYSYKKNLNERRIQRRAGETGDIVRFSSNLLELFVQLLHKKMTVNEEQLKLKQFLRKIVYLQGINLDELDDHLKKKCFFINIFNLLYLHSKRIYKLEFRKNRDLFYRTMSYNVGGVSFSLYDIKYKILFPFLGNPISNFKKDKIFDIKLKRKEWDWRIWVLLCDERFITMPYFFKKNEFLEYAMKQKSFSLFKFDNNLKIIRVPFRLKKSRILYYLKFRYSGYKIEFKM